MKVIRLLLFVLLLFHLACQNERTPIDSYNEDLETTAYILNRCMKDESFRAYADTTYLISEIWTRGYFSDYIPLPKISSIQYNPTEYAENILKKRQYFNSAGFTLKGYKANIFLTYKEDTAYWVRELNYVLDLDKIPLDVQLKNYRKNDIDKSSLDILGLCPEAIFNLSISKQIEVRGKYFECEPNFVSRLVLVKDKQVIYKADSLTRFEFMRRNWPATIQINDTGFKVLLEFNSGNRKNRILMLEYGKNKLLRIDTIPLFTKPPSDIDNDGNNEFAAAFDYYPQNMDFIPYEPIICYERTLKGLYLDTAATRKINLELWGTFLGMERSKETRIPFNPKALQFE
jgi:hypothetical protein